MTKLVKVTAFYGAASGDGECFCFCRCRSDLQHALSERRDPGACRLYPGALLPDGAEGQRGAWRVTVEFEPAGR